MKNRALVKYVCMLVVCFVLGSVGGLIATAIGNNFSVEKFEDIISKIGYYAMPVLSLLIFLFVVIIAACNYDKAQKKAAIWDGEDEDVVNDVENKLNVALIISNTGFILNCVLLSIYICVLIYVFDKALISRTTITLVFLISELAIYFVTLIFTMIFQQKILNLIKKISPEKQVNVYDSKFESKWLDSCDEAEKITIYKSGYKAYASTSKVVVILWIFSILGAAFLDVNAWVPIVIGIIWMTMIISYQKEAYRLEKH